MYKNVSKWWIKTKSWSETKLSKWL